MIVHLIHGWRTRSRIEAELRRFHDAELREIGVTTAEIDAFLRGR